MRSHLGRAVAAFSTFVVILTVGVIPAWAAPGPGTFTKITTPSKALHFPYDSVTPANNHFTVTGTTSFDVTTVDIVCTYARPDTGTLVAGTLASGVPVANGSFTTSAVYGNPTSLCRLRAVPSGVDPLNDSLQSYTGPLLYTSTVLVATDGSTAYDYTALDQQGNGFAALGGAGSCGVSLIATFDLSGPLLFGPAHQGCALAIPGSDVRAGGPSTASAITVDGQNAYLPYAVEHFLINQLALTVTQSPLTVTKTIFPSGDIRVTESSTLMKCSASNAYPPTSVSCPSLVSTHVIFKRVADLFRGAHQIRFRDSYTSSDGVAHAVAVQYETQFASPPTGSMGYTFPGHSQTFARVGAGTSVSSFGPRAGTMQVRSNMYAADDDLTADTHGITWSRPPSKAQFGSDLDLFALNYTVEVPAAGGAYLGFATSEAPLTAAVRPLAAIARAEMVSTPVITSPKNKATIKGTKTTVKGKVARGANGLAKSVVINGHKAKLTTTSTGVIYAVTFHEKIGRHTIKVVATDAVGNTASKSVKVRNKRKT